MDGAALAHRLPARAVLPLHPYSPPHPSASSPHPLPLIPIPLRARVSAQLTFLYFFSWLQNGVDKGDKGYKDSRFGLLLLPAISSPLWRINLDVMFTALVDFVEEPVGFKILYTTQSRSSTIIA